MSHLSSHNVKNDNRNTNTHGDGDSNGNGTNAGKEAKTDMSLLSGWLSLGHGSGMSRRSQKHCCSCSLFDRTRI